MLKGSNLSDLREQFLSLMDIDFNAQLLEELTKRAEGLAIKTCQADLTRFRDCLGEEVPEVIIYAHPPGRIESAFPFNVGLLCISGAGW